MGDGFITGGSIIFKLPPLVSKYIAVIFNRPGVAGAVL